MSYTYNKRENIRTASKVEVIYSSNRGFIGLLNDVEYKQSDDTWISKGSRWLINIDDIQDIMDNGFKSAKIGN